MQRIEKVPLRPDFQKLHRLHSDDCYPHIVEGTETSQASPLLSTIGLEAVAVEGFSLPPVAVESIEISLPDVRALPKVDAPVTLPPLTADRQLLLAHIEVRLTEWLKTIETMHIQKVAVVVEALQHRVELLENTTQIQAAALLHRKEGAMPESLNTHCAAAITDSMKQDTRIFRSFRHHVQAFREHAASLDPPAEELLPVEQYPGEGMRAPSPLCCRGADNQKHTIQEVTTLTAVKGTGDALLEASRVHAEGGASASNQIDWQVSNENRLFRVVPAAVGSPDEAKDSAARPPMRRPNFSKVPALLLCCCPPSHIPPLVGNHIDLQISNENRLFRAVPAAADSPDEANQQELPTRTILSESKDEAVKSVEVHGILAMDSGGLPIQNVATTPETPPNLRARRFFEEENRSQKLLPTCWEASLLAFIPGCRCNDSLSIVAGIFISMTLQSLLCWLLPYVGFEKQYPHVSELIRWRRTDAHHYSNADPTSGRSLARRVCESDPSLSVASVQSILKEDIDSYMSNFTPFGFWSSAGIPAGVLLSFLLIFIWSGICAVNVGQALSFARAVVDTTVSVHTRITVWDSSWSIQSITAKRKTICVIITCGRIFIALRLFVTGCTLLGKAPSLADLLVDGVALAFILDLDPIVYDAVVSSRLKRNLLQLDLMLIEGRFGARPIRLCLPICGALVGLFLFVLPTFNDLAEIDHALCTGNLDYVYGIHSETRLPYAAPTSAKPLTSSDAHDALVGELIEAVGKRTAVVEFVHMSSLPSMTARLASGIRSLVHDRGLPGCVDHDLTDRNMVPTFVHKTLERSTGVPELRKCSQVSEKCFDSNQSFLRLYCSTTCGCGSPLSGLFLDTAEYGCPDQHCKDADSGPYRHTVNTMPCEDFTGEQLTHMTGWEKSWQLPVDYWGRYSETQKARYGALRDIFTREGCTALVPNGTLYGERDNWCKYRSTAFLPNVTMFCPVACGCSNASKMEDIDFQISCPQTCLNITV